MSEVIVVIARVIPSWPKSRTSVSREMIFIFIFNLLVILELAASHPTTYDPSHTITSPTRGPTQSVHGWAILDRYEGDGCEDGTVVLSSGVPTNICIATTNKVTSQASYLKIDCDSANYKVQISMYTSAICSGNAYKEYTHTYSEGCGDVSPELSNELGNIFELYGYNSTKLTCSDSRDIPIAGPYVLYEGFPSKKRCDEEDAVLYNAFKTGYCFHTADSSSSVRFEKNGLLAPYIDGWFPANLFVEDVCNEGLLFDILSEICKMNTDDEFDFDMALNYSTISYSRFRYNTNGYTQTPTQETTQEPTQELSQEPSQQPSVAPSALPTYVTDTSSPSATPSSAPPTVYPSTTSLPPSTSLPSSAPTTLTSPSRSPTAVPTSLPNRLPTETPSTGPSMGPYVVLTNTPSVAPTLSPTTNDGVVGSIGSATTGRDNKESGSAIIASVCLISVLIIIVALWYYSARKKSSVVDNAFKTWMDPATAASTETVKEGISDGKGPVKVYNVNPMHVQLQERRASVKPTSENVNEEMPPEVRPYSIARRSMPTVQEETEEIDHRPVSVLRGVGTNYDDQMANDEMERTRRRQLNARPSFVKKYNFFEDVAEGIITHKDIRTNKEIVKDIADDV